MSQQRVWLKEEAPLNMSSKVVTLETARKRTCVCVRVWIGMWRKQAYEGKEMYVRHIRMRGERERKKSSKEVHFFLSIIMDGRQLKILTYPRRCILVKGTGTFKHRLHKYNAACVEV